MNKLDETFVCVFNNEKIGCPKKVVFYQTDKWFLLDRLFVVKVATNNDSYQYLRLGWWLVVEKNQKVMNDSSGTQHKEPEILWQNWNFIHFCVHYLYTTLYIFMYDSNRPLVFESFFSFFYMLAKAILCYRLFLSRRFCLLF